MAEWVRGYSAEWGLFGLPSIASQAVLPLIPDLRQSASHCFPHKRHVDNMSLMQRY